VGCAHIVVMRVWFARQLWQKGDAEDVEGRCELEGLAGTHQRSESGRGQASHTS
jgi:hypothetical protein